MNTLKKIVLTLIFVFGTALSFQALADSDPPPPPGSHGAPIDGGVSLLLAFGAGYGIYKARKTMKNNDKSDSTGD